MNFEQTQHEFELGHISEQEYEGALLRDAQNSMMMLGNAAQTQYGGLLNQAQVDPSLYQNLMSQGHYGSQGAYNEALSQAYAMQNVQPLHQGVIYVANAIPGVPSTKRELSERRDYYDCKHLHGKRDLRRK